MKENTYQFVNLGLPKNQTNHQHWIKNLEEMMAKKAWIVFFYRYKIFVTHQKRDTFCKTHKEENKEESKVESPIQIQTLHLLSSWFVLRTKK